MSSQGLNILRAMYGSSILIRFYEKFLTIPSISSFKAVETPPRLSPALIYYEEFDDHPRHAHPGTSNFSFPFSRSDIFFLFILFHTVNFSLTPRSTSQIRYQPVVSHITLTFASLWFLDRNQGLVSYFNPCPPSPSPPPIYISLSCCLRDSTCGWRFTIDISVLYPDHPLILTGKFLGPVTGPFSCHRRACCPGAVSFALNEPYVPFFDPPLWLPSLFVFVGVGGKQPPLSDSPAGSRS